MLKFLANLLRRKPPEQVAPGNGVIADEQTPIYEELAMTEELHEALFPKTPQMVSAIFDRPLPPLGRRPNAPTAPPPTSDGGSFPIIF